MKKNLDYDKTQGVISLIKWTKGIFTWLSLR